MMDAKSLVHCNRNILSFNHSSSACVHSQARLFRNELRFKLNHRPLSFNSKCRIVASSKSVSGEKEEKGSKSSSLSALEILKTSAADRKSSFSEMKVYVH